MRDFGALWQGVSVGRRNQLLRFLVNAMYVDLGARKIIALQPKEAFLVPVSTMAEKVGLRVLEDTRAAADLCNPEEERNRNIGPTCRWQCEPQGSVVRGFRSDRSTRWSERCVHSRG